MTSLSALYPPIESREETPRLSHFWVVSAPFFHVGLYLLAEDGVICGYPIHIQLFDAGGSPCSDVLVEFKEGGSGYVDLHDLMTGFKIDYGLRHGHLRVMSSERLSHCCRITSGETSSVVGQPLTIASGKSAFVPFVYNTAAENLAAIVNYSTEPAYAFCRTYIEGELSETRAVIPPLGTRLVLLEGVANSPGEPEKFGYFEVATKGGGAYLGLQIITYSSAPEGYSCFSVT